MFKKFRKSFIRHVSLFAAFLVLTALASRPCLGDDKTESGQAIVFDSAMIAADLETQASPDPLRHSEGVDMFEVWASIALFGLWSCVGVIYKNSRKASRQLDEVVKLLAEIAAKK